MKKIKLLISDGMASEGLSLLEKSELFTISFYKQIEKEELHRILSEFEAIVIRSATKLKEETLSAGSNLKLIMRAGSGVDNIDMEKASQMGILVFNTPGANNNAVVELTLGFLFSLLRKIPQATASIKAGKWEKKTLSGLEVEKRNLGVIGLGAIGTSVAKKASLLGMEVLAYDVNMAAKQIGDFVKKANSMEEVFEKSSVVSIHVPLMKATRNLIGRAQFSKMQKGAFFINCSRGGIVVEEDLLEALENEQIAGAAMDVFFEEPITEKNKLTLHPNFICSPHVGAATKESQTKVAISAATSLINYFKNKDTKFALNKNNFT